MANKPKRDQLSVRRIQVNMPKFFKEMEEGNKIPTISHFALYMNCTRQTIHNYFSANKSLGEQFYTKNEVAVWDLLTNGKITQKTLDRYLVNMHREYYKTDSTLSYRDKTTADIEKLNSLKDTGVESVETDKYIIDFGNNSKNTLTHLLEKNDG